MRMGKLDIMSVLVIAILAGVVVTMFMQGHSTIAEAPIQEAFTLNAPGWGQVQGNHSAVINYR